MKKHIKVIISILSLILLFSLTGCNNTLKYDKPYTEYVYMNSEGVFMKSGRILTLSSDDTFTLVFDEDLTLAGTVEHIEKEQTIYLDCDENTSQVVKDRFKEKVLSDPENILSIDIIDMMLQGITISEEIHYYKKYIYSSKFISAHRYIDTDLYQYGEDYSQFEGVYSVKDYDGLMLLKNGEIYVQDSENPQVGQFPLYKGSYILGNDFITMTINDNEGNPQPPQKYLVAELTIPFNLSADKTLSPDEDSTESEQWYEDIEDQMEELQGQKIKVLVLAFYTRENM